jgi:succinate dehydrogenase/fumarate reductase flavoprotein subunit
MEANKTLSEEKIETDVLVVGAGGGGLTASITAADCGAKVVLCEKCNSRRSGGIPGGNDHFLCYIPEIHGTAFRDSFIKSILNMGMSDEDVVNIWVDRSYEVLRKWESWGAKMRTNGHYEYVGQTWPGTSGKMGEPGKTDRHAIHFSDDELCVKLEKQARARHVSILNRVMITELLIDEDGRVRGAVGINTREPVLYAILAKSVIFNAGGVENRLYPYPDVIEYSMAQPGTGDGIMMAYRAGADIYNAEFSTRQVSLRFGPFAGKGTWIGVVRNSEGNPIAPPYLEHPNAETGDPSIGNADAFDQVWSMGKGPVWVDPREISKEDEEYMKWGFRSEALHPLLQWFDQEKIDIKKTRFEFSPRQPRTSIQARIDVNFRTTVEGLYSIPHKLLSLSAVGGMVAGEAAARDAKSACLTSPEMHRDTINLLKERYEELVNRTGTQFADWREVQWAIWQIMQGYASPHNRTENTLKAGYNQLLRLRERAKCILKASNQHDLYHCFEVLNLLDIAELVILAVNERKESRNQARRKDYPFTNPQLDRLLIITQKEGHPTFRWEKPRKPSREVFIKGV